MGAMKKRENKTTLNVKILSKKVCATKIIYGDVQVFIYYVLGLMQTDREIRPQNNDRQYNIKIAGLLYIHKTYSLGLGKYFITFRKCI
jgi:hypothetical protein